MAHVNKVMRSINTPDGGRCVDIFLRPDGTFGFEEFRRDVEDPSGWFAIGGHIDKVFDTEQDAADRALVVVSWFRDTAI
ncbi:MAG: hypothetical protein HQ494_06290 [Rhodospirillales bacterium]|nr:hypothetical protein [Rhodospirillales bacterium]